MSIKWWGERGGEPGEHGEGRNNSTAAIRLTHRLYIQKMLSIFFQTWQAEPGKKSTSQYREYYIQYIMLAYMLPWRRRLLWFVF